MNHLTKALLVGGIAVLAIPGSDALAEVTTKPSQENIAAAPSDSSQAPSDSSQAPSDSSQAPSDSSGENGEVRGEGASEEKNTAADVAGDSGAASDPSSAQEHAVTDSADDASAEKTNTPPDSESAKPGDEQKTPASEAAKSANDGDDSAEAADSSDSPNGDGDAVGGEIERNFESDSGSHQNDSRAVDPDEAKHRAIMGEEIDQEIDRATDQAVTEAMEVSGDNDDPEAQRAVDQAITEAVDEAMAQASARRGLNVPYHTPGTHGNELAHLRNLRATSSVSGGTGLLRTESAILGMSGVARISLLGEFTSQGSFPTGGTEVTHAAGRFAGSLTFLRYFEGFFSYRIASDYADMGDDSELNQTLGDFRFGLKGSNQVFDGFYLGGAVHFGLMPGFGSDWDGGTGFEFIPEILVSWDARSINRGVPVVLHLNLGAAFSNQDKIYNDYAPSAFEQFALDINRYSRLLIALGIEIPLPYVTPYAEWDMALPITSATLHDFDGKSVSAGQAMSNRFAFGGKITALPDVTFTAGFEFGLNAKTARGVASTPAFMFHFGLSYSFDPLLNHRRDKSTFVDLPPVALPETPEEQQPASPHDDPVEQEQHSDDAAPPASAADEAETSQENAAESAAEVSGTAASENGGEDDETDEEKAAAKPKLFLMAKGAAVSGRVYVLEDTSKSFDVSPEGTEIPLEAGTWKVAVAAEGYLAQAADLEVPPEAQEQDQEAPKVQLTADAKPRPQKATVTVSGDELKLDGKIAFMGKSSKFRSDAADFLDQIADLMLTGKAARLSIECHTDFPKNSNSSALLELSQARADAVKKALVERGISDALLEAKGFGGSKPIKPNGLPKGREMNRRVEFKILP